MFIVSCLLLLSALRVPLFIVCVPEINMSEHKISPPYTHSPTCSYHHDKTHVVMATGGGCFGDLMKQGDQGNNGSSLESLRWVGYGAKHRTLAASTSPSGSWCGFFLSLTLSSCILTFTMNYVTGCKLTSHSFKDLFIWVNNCFCLPFPIVAVQVRESFVRYGHSHTLDTLSATSELQVLTSLQYNCTAFLWHFIIWYKICVPVYCRWIG